jgi:hypothetical protein
MDSCIAEHSTIDNATMSTPPSERMEIDPSSPRSVVLIVLMILSTWIDLLGVFAEMQLMVPMTPPGCI